ncbi:MAG TPA: trypsin-like peptidase domain-containing protein [Candidatus Acidoferrales bacterium]|nr:trypsin-like peptidase domain-containing protein [Candidatus Acidoferrales bacterium]
MRIQLRELASWVGNRKLVAGLLVALTLCIGIIIGTVVSGRVSATHAFLPNGATPLDLPNPVSLSNAFGAIVERDEPAVVNISTTQVIERKGEGPGHGGGADPFHDFFNRFFDSPNQGPDAERSLGSGMIVDKKGFILTNNHVIEQATKIQVQLNGAPTLYTAKVIGADKETDLAVIKIEANRDLPIVKLGNSGGVHVGDWVLAIGSPFGLQATVTAGIISAKDRGNVGRQFQHFLQTDAPINPGNSGGPLVDMSGNVIGINTAIMTGGRGYEGVGFALPSNMAINVYNQLVERGKVTRGSIGITFTEEQSSNPIVLHELGASNGMVLQYVEPDSPAAKAGIEAGDVVTSVNGKTVKSGSDLVDPITQTPVGTKVHIVYMRGGTQHDAEVTVEDRAKLFPDRVSSLNDDQVPAQPAQAAPADFGLRVDDVGSNGTRRADFRDSRGAVVSEVDPATFAEDVGFMRGDLIQEMNHQRVNSAADYHRLAGGLKAGQDVVFKVLRHADNERMLTVFLAGIVPQLH